MATPNWSKEDAPKTNEEMTKNNRQSDIRYANVDEANVESFKAKGYEFADIGGVHKPDSRGNFLMGIPKAKHQEYVDRINANQREVIKKEAKKFPGKLEIEG